VTPGSPQHLRRATGNRGPVQCVSRGSGPDPAQPTSSCGRRRSPTNPLGLGAPGPSPLTGQPAAIHAEEEQGEGPEMAEMVLTKLSKVFPGGRMAMRGELIRLHQQTVLAGGHDG